MVCGFGIGAPAAAMVLEDLIAVGVRRILSIGIAGCLQPDIDFGELVLCTAALRDGGVSHHYLPAARFAHPAPGLTDMLRVALRERGLSAREGPTWTIDAVYRETIDEARAYQAEAIATVEMEAAALFAVAACRGVEVASAFVVSDHLLAAEQWISQISSDRVNASLERLLEVSVQALGGRLPDARPAAQDEGWARSRRT
jgi:uridine phosphorylase